MLLSKLKNILDSRLGTNWPDFETETILLELELEDTLLNRDSINTLRVITLKPNIFFEDALFFSHATTVMNEETADFDTLIFPTSLEIALALVEMAILLKTQIDHLPKFSEGVQEVTKFVLINEGYSKPIFPFNVIGVSGLVKGQLPSDTKNKEKAIETYVSTMYS